MSVDDAVKALHAMLDDPQTPHALKAKGSFTTCSTAEACDDDG